MIEIGNVCPAKVFNYIRNSIHHAQVRENFEHIACDNYEENNLTRKYVGKVFGNQYLCVLCGSIFWKKFE